MRKYVLAGIVCGGILLTGCSGSNPFTSDKLPDLSGGFSSRAEVDYGKFRAQAEIDRICPGSWEFRFTSPEELAGVVMTVEDGKLSANLGDITVSDSGGDHTALPLIVADAIDGLSGLSAGEFSEKDGVLTANSNIAGSHCTVTIDKATGQVLSLKSRSDKLAVYFSDISPYTEEVGLIE